MRNHKVGQVVFLPALALLVGSCATLQPPGVTGPRGNEPVYPVLFNEDSHRREASLVAANQLTKQSGNSQTTAPQLQPVTATIESLPANTNGLLYLPKFGVGGVMNEDETRESLRRFIKDWHELIGADPAKLSLVERLDQPDGSKLANYEQRPFRYPIRGNYGKLHIRFATDRSVLNLSSTCIPDADRIQTALAAISIKLTAEDAIKKLSDSDMAYKDAGGNTVNFRVPSATVMKPGSLVTYVLASRSKADALEFHIAWETELSNVPVKNVYVDAVNGEIIAAE